MIRSARYGARRLVQTPQAFSNWPSVLGQLALEGAGFRARTDLTFVTRSGARLLCPNVPGARLPMYEQYADDCYRREWLLGSEEQLDVLDVGSHVGAFAINLATARPTVHVECYEPSPHSARYLRSNVAANGVADRVRVHETAMAAEVGEAVLEDNVGASVHNGLVTGGHRLVSGEVSPGTPAAIRVPTTTFDRAVAAAPRPFDVVKMDCEGVEYELVYASTPSSWASVKRIVMEYHPVAGQSWEQLRSWFEDHGFRVVRQHSTGPGLGTAWLARSS